MAETAACNMINDYSIALLKAVYTLADTFDNATWLVASDDAAICLRACALVTWSVDGS